MTPRTDAALRFYADNAVLLLVSRLAMAVTPVVASALVYLGGHYLDARFEIQRVAVADIDQRRRYAQAETDGIRAALADLRQAVAVNAHVVATMTDQQRQTHLHSFKMRHSSG